jgi:hypothetical protein
VALAVIDIGIDTEQDRRFDLAEPVEDDQVAPMLAVASAATMVSGMFGR